MKIYLRITDGSLISNQEIIFDKQQSNLLISTYRQKNAVVTRVCFSGTSLYFFSGDEIILFVRNRHMQIRLLQIIKDKEEFEVFLLLRDLLIYKKSDQLREYATKLGIEG